MPVLYLKTKDFHFDSDQLIQQGRNLHQQYISASPYPHIILDNFLPPKVAQRVLKDFPGPDCPHYQQPDNANQVNKLGRLQDQYFKGVPDRLRNLLYEFNAKTFIDFLEALTGIEAIIPDPHYHGGALHLMLPGGKLDLHADYNKDVRTGLDRRINVLFYVNENWQEEYGGYLELWDKDLSQCHQRIAPILNRCVIFNTTSETFHGHPHPLSCPEGMARKSLAFYYYTNGRPEAEQNGEHNTVWKQAPELDA
ncbi:MAG: 2OG-Fe(II) oxygenase [Arenicellales bacterium]